MFEFEPHTEKLIKAMKPRPALYNKLDTMYYSHRKHKGKLWREVCKEVFTNWDQFKPQEKVECQRDMQRRWKSLRTCFARELNFQKQEQKKKQRQEPIKKRKKYEYFDQMTFLLENPSDSGENKVASESDSSDDDPLETNVKLEENETSEPNCSISIERVARNNITMDLEPDLHYQNTSFFNSSSMEQKILEQIRDVRKDEEDEDRQFVMSLIPSFRRLSDKQKFEARIEILQVLKRLSFQQE